MMRNCSAATGMGWSGGIGRGTASRFLAPSLLYQTPNGFHSDLFNKRLINFEITVNAYAESWACGTGHRVRRFLTALTRPLPDRRSVLQHPTDRRWPIQEMCSIHARLRSATRRFKAEGHVGTSRAHDTVRLDHPQPGSQAVDEPMPGVKTAAIGGETARGCVYLRSCIFKNVCGSMRSAVTVRSGILAISCFIRMVRGMEIGGFLFPRFGALMRPLFFAQRDIT